MRWTTLQYLLAVERAGSLRGAAKSTGVNHATLSRHLRGLEEELGARLFERDGRRLVLSPSGSELLEIARDIDDRLTAACRRVAGRDAGLVGEVRVALPWALIRIIAPHLTTFAEQLNDLRLTLVTGLGFADLASRQADIAVRVADQPLETLVGRRVGTLRVKAYGSAELLNACEPCGLKDYPWAGWDDAHQAFPMEAWLRSAVPQSARKWSADSEDGLFELVRAGAGVGFLPQGAAELAGLLEVAAPTPVFTSSIWVLTHPDQRGVPRIQATTQWLSALLQDQEN